MIRIYNFTIFSSLGEAISIDLESFLSSLFSNNQINKNYLINKTILIFELNSSK